MVGAGPFARLTAQAAISLNVDFRVLAAAPHDPAAQVALFSVMKTPGYRIAEFAESCHVLTFEDFRHPAVAQLPGLERLTEVRPGARAVRLAGSGWAELLREHGACVCAGDPSAQEQQLAVLVARSPKGQGASYPVVRLVRQGGECVEVIAPAPLIDADLAVSAQGLALRLAAEFDVTGLMTVEFVASNAEILVTGLVLGPHDAGLWSVEGSRTSQFSQLVRALLDLPFGTTATSAGFAVTVKVIGGQDDDLYPRLVHVLAADPGVSAHLYGIPSGPGQQIGHVTVTGEDLSQVRDRAWRAASYLGMASEDRA